MRDDPVGADGGEDATIARIAALLGDEAPGGEVWIGDDAAWVASPPGHLLVATDAVVAGVHADLSVVGLADVGFKAVAVNVSDIAAMGGTPSYAVVSLVAPVGTDVDALYRGIADASHRYACPVVGGDLSTSATLVVTVAVIGEVDNGEPVRRSGAAPGDTVFVTGPLGGSAAALRRLREGAPPSEAAAHLRPEARVPEGQAARRAGATAMIDVSDGFGIDLHRLADASGVGWEVARIPVAPGASREEALGGGEDYELIFTAPDVARVAGEFAAGGLRAPVAVGSCTHTVAVRTVDGVPLGRTGWEHRIGVPAPT